MGKWLVKLYRLTAYTIVTGGPTRKPNVGHKAYIISNMTNVKKKIQPMYVSM